MLTINLPGREYYDEAANRFITTKPLTLRLEHSLISISKWESKWHKPFLGTERKTREEELDYIRCMSLDKIQDSTVLLGLSASDFEAIRTYLEDSMTATTFHNKQKSGKHGIVTSEIIYYWMTELNIPFECEKWNLNRLLTLIRVCDLKKSPGKKMKRRDALAQQRSLNAARRAKSGSRG